MEGAEAERAGVCARGCVRVCMCVCVCVGVCARARARVWLGVRLFGELTGEPGPSRGRADSAGCRGQPVLQPRPLNQPAPPDLCSPPRPAASHPRGAARAPGQQGATDRWAVKEGVAPSLHRKGKMPARRHMSPAVPRTLLPNLPPSLFGDFLFLIPKIAFPCRDHSYSHGEIIFT